MDGFVFSTLLNFCFFEFFCGNEPVSDSPRGGSLRLHRGVFLLASSGLLETQFRENIQRIAKSSRHPFRLRASGRNQRAIDRRQSKPPPIAKPKASLTPHLPYNCRMPKGIPDISIVSSDFERRAADSDRALIEHVLFVLRLGKKRILPKSVRFDQYPSAGLRTV
jgi:hypothetical protein